MTGLGFVCAGVWLGWEWVSGVDSFNGDAGFCSVWIRLVLGWEWEVDPFCGDASQEHVLAQKFYNISESNTLTNLCILDLTFPYTTLYNINRGILLCITGPSCSMHL